MGARVYPGLSRVYIRPSTVIPIGAFAAGGRLCSFIFEATASDGGKAEHRAD